MVAKVGSRPAVLTFLCCFCLGVVVALIPLKPANALCTFAQTHVLGKDVGTGRVGTRVGVRGDVRLPSDFDTNHGNIRSVIVYHTYPDDFVEAGWSKGTDFIVSGSEFFGEIWQMGQKIESWDSQFSLEKDTVHQFKAHDANGDGIWSVALDGGSSSHNMDQVSFTVGSAFGNTEIHDNSSCDNPYSRFFNLQNCSGSCSTWVNWGDAECSRDTITGYHFERTSYKEYFVKTGQTQAGCY